MEEHKPEPIPEESLALGYEVRDVNLPNLVRLSLILVGVVVIVFVLIGLLYNFLTYNLVARSAPPPPLLGEAQGPPPEPLLQRNPALDMQQMATEQEAILNSYGWVDKEAGVVRIPIERAIELTLERGLPTQEQGQE
jgi:hypothetical protein